MNEYKGSLRLYRKKDGRQVLCDTYLRKPWLIYRVWFEVREVDDHSGRFELLYSHANEHGLFRRLSFRGSWEEIWARANGIYADRNFLRLQEWDARITWTTGRKSRRERRSW